MKASITVLAFNRETKQVEFSKFPLADVDLAAAFVAHRKLDPNYGQVTYFRTEEGEA